MTLRALAIAVFCVTTAAACSTRYEGATVAFDVPNEAGFDQVTIPLVYFCGSLDCHGAIGRNLRLYGSPGRRLNPKDVPCGADTTAAEVHADYESVIALEPEVLSSVVQDGGQHPERLTIVRKARGAEKHTGGVVFAPGSAGDLCLTEWIAGQATDAGVSCRNAIPQNPRPLCAE
jgi:hypothetical protein